VLGIYRGHGGMRKQWYEDDGPVPYIRTSNISGLEIEYHSNHVRAVSDTLYERRSQKRGSTRVIANDILFVRRGEDRIGDVAIVYDGFERILTANELDIVRVLEPDNEYGITPFSLRTCSRIRRPVRSTSTKPSTRRSSGTLLTAGDRSSYRSPGARR
jgi:hypothetical protein